MLQLYHSKPGLLMDGARTRALSCSKTDSSVEEELLSYDERTIKSILLGKNSQFGLVGNPKFKKFVC